MPQLLDPGHEIVCGTIGMGKSYWVLYKIVQSLIHDRPCAYVDPKGDTYRALLSFFADTHQGRELWEERKSRILLVNPVATGDWLVGFNAIEPMGGFLHASPDPIALLANSIVSHIRRQSGFEVAEANRMQNFMTACIGLLAEGGQRELTLAELPLLSLPSYRHQGKRRVAEVHNPLVRSLLPQVTHQGTLSFWKDQWPTWTANARREWVQSTEGRIFQYLFDQRLLMTVCTVENATLDFRRVVDQGRWLFVNIPYALLSDAASTVLGNLIITKILYACMQRPPGERPYRLILDEARFFNTGPLEVILETSRAYNLWLTLVVQNLDQMARMREGRVDLRLKEAAINLCRYFSIFHNLSDAELFARMMFPVTGRVPVGIRTSGDFEYLPVPAEEDEHERRFVDLGHREMVFYDKLGSEPPRAWRTPEVIMDQPEQSGLDRFERRHLRATGRPVSEIAGEIARRQEKVRALFDAQKPGGRTLPGLPSGSGSVTKRFQRIQRRGIELTDLDFRMVEAVFWTRYLTNRMMARLFFKPTAFSWCKQKMRHLFDLGYLNKRRAYVNDPDIYFLGPKGRGYVATLGEYTREQVNRIAGVSGGRDPAPMLMMEHELTLSRLYVNARLECREHGWEMRWKNTRMLELERLEVEPDAWIEVINGPKSKQAFLEFTAAMPTQSELAGKIEGYQGYWERTGQPVPVLWLTTSQSKANRLWEGVLQSTYEDYFLVGLVEDAGRFLTRPMWRWSESEERVRWVAPPP